MTSTGYQTIVFTEINPTSTTTPITMSFNLGDGYFGAVYTEYDLGPVTIVSNSVPLPPLTTPSVSSPPLTTPNMQPTTVTVDSTVTVTKSSGTLTRPPCEFIIAELSSMALWLLALPVSS